MKSYVSEKHIKLYPTQLKPPYSKHKFPTLLATTTTATTATTAAHHDITTITTNNPPKPNRISPTILNRSTTNNNTSNTKPIINLLNMNNDLIMNSKSSKKIETINQLIMQKKTLKQQQKTLTKCLKANITTTNTVTITANTNNATASNTNIAGNPYSSNNRNLNKANPNANSSINMNLNAYNNNPEYFHKTLIKHPKKQNPKQNITNDSFCIQYDENTNPNVHDIITHRFSDIYKPSKFIKSNEISMPKANKAGLIMKNHESKGQLSGKKLHSRHRSDVNLPSNLDSKINLASNLNKPKLKVEEIPKFNKFSANYGEYYANFENSKGEIRGNKSNYYLGLNHEKNMNNSRQSSNENSDNSWSFQTIYKANRAKIEKISGDEGDDFIDNITPKKSKLSRQINDQLSHQINQGIKILSDQKRNLGYSDDDDNENKPVNASMFNHQPGNTRNSYGKANQHAIPITKTFLGDITQVSNPKPINTGNNIPKKEHNNPSVEKETSIDKENPTTTAITASTATAIIASKVYNKLTMIVKNPKDQVINPTSEYFPAFNNGISGNQENKLACYNINDNNHENSFSNIAQNQLNGNNGHFNSNSSNMLNILKSKSNEITKRMSSKRAYNNTNNPLNINSKPQIFSFNPIVDSDHKDKSNKPSTKSDTRYSLEQKPINPKLIDVSPNIIRIDNDNSQKINQTHISNHERKTASTYISNLEATTLECEESNTSINNTLLTHTNNNLQGNHNHDPHNEKNINDRLDNTIMISSLPGDKNMCENNQELINSNNNNLTTLHLKSNILNQETAINPKTTINTHESISQPHNKLSLEAELNNFLKENKLIESIYECMIKKEKDKDYHIDPYYFNTIQKAINWLMRAILIDWMMEVCSEFSMKRETLYIAINYVDRYLTIKPNIEKWNLQLVGVTALFLASKMEEVIPLRLKDFARSADDTYSASQIIDMEIDMSKALKWKLVPQTLYNWGNHYMICWDEFISANASFEVNNMPKPYFRKQSEDSYVLFRKFIQYLDCAILHYETLQYQIRTLVASFLYIILAKYYGIFDDNTILNELTKTSIFLYKDLNGFNALFAQFLIKFFNFELFELLPTIQYSAHYFGLVINNELPVAFRRGGSSILTNINYEEFLSYQTHTTNNLELVKSLGKGLNK